MCITVHDNMSNFHDFSQKDTTDTAVTLAKWHRRIPLMDPLCGARTCGAGLSNKSEALVAAEAQTAA